MSALRTIYRHLYLLLRPTEQERREWLHKGQEMERKRWEKVQAVLLCPRHHIPLTSQIVAGQEVFACPMQHEHQTGPQPPVVPPNPYQQPGQMRNQYIKENTALRPTEQMKAAAPPNGVHVPRLEHMTTGHQALPTEQGDRFTL